MFKFRILNIFEINWVKTLSD